MAPARSYALMLLGIALLLPASVLQPHLFNAFAQANTGRFFAFGLAVLLYGFLDALRHGNRYCGDCGCRLHAVRGKAQIRMPIPGRAAAATPATRPATTGHARRTKEEKPLDPNTPIEPVLKCLRFKNEKMRSDAAETLRALTGEDFGTDADAWEAWWRDNRDAFRAKRQSGE